MLDGPGRPKTSPLSLSLSFSLSLSLSLSTRQNHHWVSESMELNTTHNLHIEPTQEPTHITKRFMPSASVFSASAQALLVFLLHLKTEGAAPRIDEGQ